MNVDIKRNVYRTVVNRGRDMGGEEDTGKEIRGH